MKTSYLTLCDIAICRSSRVNADTKAILAESVNSFVSKLPSILKKQAKSLVTAQFVPFIQEYVKSTLYSIQHQSFISKLDSSSVQSITTYQVSVESNLQLL